MTYKIFKFFHCIGTILVVVLVAAVLCFYVFGDVEWIPFEWLPVELVYKEICDGKPVECLESPDSIHIAVQLGRLDFVTTALTILGTVIGFSAIFSFLYVKKEAVHEANIVANKVMEDYMERQTRIISSKVEDLVAAAIAATSLNQEDYTSTSELIKNDSKNDISVEEYDKMDDE